MTAYPPTSYPPQGYPAPAQERTSIAAVLSLVCGILCVPLGIFAVIFSIVGFIATGKPGVKGRGFAIAGLILGLLGTVATVIVGIIGGTIFWAFTNIHKIVEKPTTDFVAALVEKTPAQLSAEYGMSMTEATAIKSKVANLGKFQSLKLDPLNFQAQANNQQQTFSLQGTATFEKGTKKFKIEFEGDNSKKSSTNEEGLHMKGFQWID